MMESNSAKIEALQADVLKFKEETRSRLDGARAETGSLKKSISRLTRRVDYLTQEAHRSSASKRAILMAAIVKFLADELSEEKRSDVNSQSRSKGKEGADNAVAADDRNAPFAASVQLILRAMESKHDSHYHRAAERAGSYYIRPVQLKKFIRDAELVYPDRAQQAHPNVSDPALLGMAFEVERAGFDVDELETLATVHIDQRLSRIIMEVMGRDRTNRAIQTLLDAQKARRTGHVESSLLPSIPPKQLLLHAGLHSIYIDEEEEEDQLEK